MLQHHTVLSELIGLASKTLHRRHNVAVPRRDRRSRSYTNDTKDQLMIVAANWRHDTIAITKRPITELPVDIDLPRMASKIRVRVLDQHNTPAPQTTSPHTVSSLLVELFGTLCTPEEQEQCRKLVATTLTRTEEAALQLRALLQDKLFREQEFVAPVLACMHQRVIFPAYYFVRSLFGHEIELRDKRGTWHVDVCVQRDNGELQNVQVKHVKTQRSAALCPDNENPVFEFDWELMITLGTRTAPSDHSTPTALSVGAVEVRIHNLKFHHTVRRKNRERVLAKLTGVQLHEC